MIPNITHQTWLQGWERLPDKFKHNVSLLDRMNPGFQHMKWDENSLRKECAKFSDAAKRKFDSFPYLIQKVDFGRYMVLYNYGGISVDTDMVSLKPIATTPNFLTRDFIVSSAAFPASMLGWINNALIMCTKHHPILLQLIESILHDNLQESDFSTKELYIDATTSPSKFNAIVKQHLHEILVLDHTYFEPCFSTDPICRPGHLSIMDHKHELSWFHGHLKYFLYGLFILFYIALFTCLAWAVVLFIRSFASSTRSVLRIYGLNIK